MRFSLPAITAGLVGGLLLGLTGGFFLARESGGGILSGTPGPLAEAGDNPGLHGSHGFLERQLREERAARAALERRLRALEREGTRPAEAAKEGGREGRRLPDSPEALEGVLRGAVEAFDPEEALEAAAALLGMGEDGWEMLIEAFREFEAWKEELREEGRLSEFQFELFAGAALRAAADHHQDLLRFALYLQEKEPGDLPEGLQFLRRASEGGLLALLLGFGGGAPPRSEELIVERLRRELEEKQGQARDELLALAQVRSERAAEALLGRLNQGGDLVQLAEVVMALGCQRSPRALPALRALRGTEADPRLHALVDWAIARIERAGARER